MAYQVKGYVAIVVIIFISFTIGLNLGLHGMLVVVQNDFSYITQRAHGAATTAEQPKPIQPAGQPITPLPATPPKVVEVKEPESRPVLVVTQAHTEPPASGASPADEQQLAPPVNTLESRIHEVEVLVDAYALKLHAETVSRLPNLAQNNDVLADVPIVLLTCNRAALLRNTLKSLLEVRGVKKGNVIVSQDGALPEIADIAKEQGLTLIQNVNGIRLRGGAAADGASRIAQHYKYSLSAVFDRFPRANAVIIVEDDLLFSPDMYEYLQHTAPILDADPTAFVVSAWSDNGFASKVHDPYALRRTDYFPGLGWLLTRKLYKEELEPKWPASHWDHWLRAPETSKHRDIIYPQVPRTYHNGIKGTFMNLETHNRYFRDIGYNTDKSVTWPPPTSTAVSAGGATGSDIGRAVYMRGHHLVDEYRIEQLVKHCKHVTTVTDLLQHKDEIICLWISISTNCETTPVAFAPVASFFGIWHEHRRGNHHGLHEFYWEGNYVLLLNVHDELGRSIGTEKRTYRHLMPPQINPQQHGGHFDKTLLADLQRRKMHVKTSKAPSAGMSCADVCRAQGQRCKAELLAVINTCDALQEQFACSECKASYGTEQPAFVDPHADLKYGPSQCLINTGPEASTCEASHPSTYRLCPCE